MATGAAQVYLQDLPLHLTDQGLKDELTRLTKGYSIHDWSCQKPRRKPFGFVTFLRATDAQRFLKLYQSQILILGTPVRCKRSNKDPDQFLVKSLEKAVEDRLLAKQWQQTQQPRETKLIFSVRSLSSGSYEYTNGGELAYSPEVEWTAADGFAKFAKHAIIIEFNGTVNNIKQRVEIPYRIVEAMTICSRHTSLILTLWEAPRFFQIVDPAQIELARMMASLSLQQTNAPPPPPRTRLVEMMGSTGTHREALGQSLVYRITCSPVSFDVMARRLHERGVLTIYNHNPTVLTSYQRKSIGDGLIEFKKAVQMWSKDVPFSVLYQLEALVKNGFLPPWTVQRLLEMMVARVRNNNRSLTKSTSKDLPITARAIKGLFRQIPFPGPDVDASVFDAKEIWKYLEENERELQEGYTKDLISERGRQNLTLVHRVNITPTGMTLHGPEPEAKNRILRRFPDHTEYFVRVQFCEEDGADLQFNSKVSNDNVYDRFKHVFKNGINIGSRVYSFLGFSHSSLRSHSAWFMAPFVHEGRLQTYFSIIAYLGKFRDITSPARCAARIGQAFSETSLAISINEHEILYSFMPDVKSRDGSRVFSDGVGTISWQAMEAIHTEIPQRKSLPTCFQIRWGGAKGMLALDPRLPGCQIRVRDSMVKFESTATENLEICDMGNKPIQMVLNRQMIKILEDMGVSDNWFFQQQENALRSLQLITAHIANTVGFLDRHSVAGHVGFPQFLRRLEGIGLDYKRDRFMSSVVEATVLRELRLLKHKARIPVKRGVTLFGIMDETGYLEEGEVYITFEKADFIDDRAMDLDNRRMIVTRSPALHPGDIQLATNIIPPDHHPLRYLRNCIVFSSKGQRDLPSCLSGGDLDGDIYGVIWDPQAVRECTRIFEPADYSAAKKLDIGREVQREDMSNFFIQFMATDQLGVIAVKHMILADQRPAGTNDPDCKILAEMHSTGVDYSKTGIPVDMTPLRRMRTDYRPDFLSPAPPANIQDRTEICFDEPAGPRPDDADEDDADGPNYQIYKSDKINGKLYRAIDERKVWFEQIKISTHKLNIWDELLRYLIAECNRKLGGLRWGNVKNEAWQIRNAYEDAISNAALEYSDHATKEITELEVFTGTIFNKAGVQTRRQRDGSLRLKDEFDRILQWTSSMIRKKDHSHEDCLALSIACLEVGSMGMQRSVQLGKGRFGYELQSFRVIAACCAMRELDAVSRVV